MSPAPVSAASESSASVSCVPFAEAVSSGDRFPEKLCKFVESRVGAVVSSLPSDQVISMSDSDIEKLARNIIEEYNIGDRAALACIVSVLQYSWRKLKKKAKKNSKKRT